MNKQIKETAEKLSGRPLNQSDGIDLHGIEAAEERLKQLLPEALKDFYALVGNMKMFMSPFEVFMKPDELYLKNDMLVFLEENQGVCYWGVPVNNKENQNLMVFMCTDMEEDTLEWHPEEVTLTDFLTILLYYQCAQGGYECGGAVYESAFDNRKKYAQFLAEIIMNWGKVVEHNGLVIYQNSDKLIWHFTDKEGNLGDTIFASTRTPEGLKELEPYGFEEL